MHAITDGVPWTGLLGSLPGRVVHACNPRTRHFRPVVSGLSVERARSQSVVYRNCYCSRKADAGTGAGSFGAQDLNPTHSTHHCQEASLLSHPNGCQQQVMNRSAQ